MNIVVTYILIILKVFLIAGIGYLACYIPRRHNRPTNESIGTIVVDNSDENTNIFLEITSDDIDQWEDGKDYTIRVEVRDYLPHK